MSILKNCPFCGAEAQYRKFGAGNDLLVIECNNPHGACCRMSTVDGEDAKRILTEKWNRREADKEISALVNAVIDLSKGI